MTEPAETVRRLRLCRRGCQLHSTSDIRHSSRESLRQRVGAASRRRARACRRAMDRFGHRAGGCHNGGRVVHVCAGSCARVAACSRRATTPVSCGRVRAFPLRAMAMQTFVRTAGAVPLAALALLAAASPVRADDLRVVIRSTTWPPATPTAAPPRCAWWPALMANAGVNVDWRDCSRGGDDHPCRTVRDARDLVVRIMPAFVPRAGDAAREQDGDGDLQLGFAAVDPPGRATVIATDLLRRRAARRAPRRSRRERSARTRDGARDRPPAAARAGPRPLGADACAVDRRGTGPEPPRRLDLLRRRAAACRRSHAAGRDARQSRSSRRGLLDESG